MEEKGRKEGKSTYFTKKINWIKLFSIDEWDNLDKSILLNLCTGMKNHLEAVIEKGDQIISH